MSFFEEFDDVDLNTDENDFFGDENKYLVDQSHTLNLISTIIGSTVEHRRETHIVNKLINMIKYECLNLLQNISITNKAMIQARLEQISIKLLKYKKYNFLHSRNIVGVGGRFSSGKSKFINSILNTDTILLPEDQNPTTSIPTYIIKGFKENVILFTFDRRKVELDSEVLPALTHKMYDQYRIGFSKFIDSLFITIPNIPFSNLAFLDTPGYNKADYNNKERLDKMKTDEEVAYEELIQVDYLIWLLDIENGVITLNDLNYIKNLNLEKPVLIVLNKCDKKIDADIELIIDKTREVVSNFGLNIYDVTAYSSRDRLEWNKLSVINTFLRGASKNKKVSNDIRNDIQSVELLINNELNNLENEQIELQKKHYSMILQSKNILDLQSLVILYGDTLNTLRSIRQARYEFRDYFNQLYSNLFKLYSIKI